MKKWILFVATILLLCSSVARADSLEDGVEAYNKGNYAQALKLLRPLASQGDAGAQSVLGAMYDKGKGITQDYKEAVKWYRLAAKQGYAAAQNNLGVMYVMGKGVTQDYVRARMWFNLAASKGDENAAESLEWMAKEMKPTQITDAQMMAQDCEKKNYRSCK